MYPIDLDTYKSGVGGFMRGLSGLPESDAWPSVKRDAGQAESPSLQSEVTRLPSQILLLILIEQALIGLSQDLLHEKPLRGICQGLDWGLPAPHAHTAFKNSNNELSRREFPPTDAPLNIVSHTTLPAELMRSRDDPGQRAKLHRNK